LLFLLFILVKLKKVYRFLWSVLISVFSVNMDKNVPMDYSLLRKVGFYDKKKNRKMSGSSFSKNDKWKV